MLGLGISLWQSATIIGTGGGGGSSVPFINISNDDISEDASAGDLIGLLSVANGSGTYAFTLTDDGGGEFELDAVDDTRFEVAGPLNYEAVPSYQVEFEADNGVDTPLTRAFTILVTNVLEIALSALTLDNDDIEDGSAPGVTVGAVQDKSSGSTLSLTDTAGNRFALSSTDVVTGVVATDFDTGTSHNITLRETHADASNSPRDSIIVITVTEIAAPGAFAPTYYYLGF